MLDISNKSVLEQYLLDRGIIRSGEEFSYNYCQGGVSCTVVFIYAGNTQLILKQGLAKLKVKEEWLCDPNRMYIEQESNRIYHSLVPDCAPEVFSMMKKILYMAGKLYRLIGVFGRPIC